MSYSRFRVKFFADIAFATERSGVFNPLFLAWVDVLYGLQSLHS